MKILITALLGTLVSFGLFGQSNTLSGTVVNMDNQQPMVGVHVYVPDLQKGVSTNSKGRFKMKDLPEGPFLIEVGYLSFNTEVLKISIKGETIVHIEMSPSIIEMAQVMVTGLAASTKRALNPTPTIVIDKVALSEKTSTNIIDAIAHEPGMSQITTGGAISKPVIRGLGYNRVVVLNNNIHHSSSSNFQLALHLF